jgi:uncharacterized membrane protein (DUF485 family)
LTIVNLSIGPIVSGTVTNFTQQNWGTLNCEGKKDDWDDEKDRGTKTDDELKYDEEYEYNKCIREKGMHDMEYTAFIFDIVIGFICGLLGLLHIFEVKKDFVSNTGLIGLICGVIGFVLTLVYVIFNGLVYTTVYALKDYGGNSPDNIYKRDGDYAIAEKDGDNYKCLYFDDEHNGNAIYAKVSDLGKKQYNYDKDISKDYTTNNKILNCLDSSSHSLDGNDIVDKCAGQEKLITGTDIDSHYKDNNCDMIYIDRGELETGIENKDLSDRFLTTLILSLFVCLASIGLALFGFLLFRTPGDF